MKLHVSYKLLFVFILSFSLLASCTTQINKVEKKPNIILIMADDLGYEGISSNGSRSYQTPNIDKLAKEGVRFTNCYSTPLCTTSRVQIMTGMYNFRNYTEFGTMPKDQITFAHLLKDEGYSTCVAGKWQLVGKYEGAGYKGQGTYPEQNGFDEYCLWQIDKFGSRYWAPLLNTNGKYQQYEENQFGPDIVCDFILDYIDRHKEEPFLLYYPMILTHDPFVPTPNSQFSEEEKHKNNPKYFKDLVEYTDLIVGRITEKLKQTNLDDNTMIIFLGDNGTHKSITTNFEDNTIRGDKGTTTSAGTHVPMIVRLGCTISKNNVCEDLIDFTDFLPTFLETAGVKDYNIPHKDGQSFFSQINGQTGAPREWIFCDYNPKWGKFIKNRYSQNKRWKLYDDGSFFDFINDPQEQNNISKNKLTPAELSIYDNLQDILNKYDKK